MKNELQIQMEKRNKVIERDFNPSIISKMLGKIGDAVEDFRLWREGRKENKEFQKQSREIFENYLSEYDKMDNPISVERILNPKGNVVREITKVKTEDEFIIRDELFSIHGIRDVRYTGYFLDGYYHKFYDVHDLTSPIAGTDKMPNIRSLKGIMMETDGTFREIDEQLAVPISKYKYDKFETYFKLCYDTAKEEEQDSLTDEERALDYINSGIFGQPPEQ